MSATALAGRSRSAWTSTGLPLTRTSHSSAVLDVVGRRPRSAARGPRATGRPITCSVFSPVSSNDPRPQSTIRPVGVAGEERRVRRRVVVVEQLEQVREPAFLAPAGLAAEAGVAVGAHRAVAAVRADEVVLVTHRRQVQDSSRWALDGLPRSARAAESVQQQVLRSDSGPGGSSPRCSKARRVAARPRGVRSISPRCSR